MNYFSLADKTRLLEELNTKYESLTKDLKVKIEKKFNCLNVINTIDYVKENSIQMYQANMKKFNENELGMFIGKNNDLIKELINTIEKELMDISKLISEKKLDFLYNDKFVKIIYTTKIASLLDKSVGLNDKISINDILFLAEYYKDNFSTKMLKTINNEEYISNVNNNNYNDYQQIDKLQKDLSLLNDNMILKIVHYKTNDSYLSFFSLLYSLWYKFVYKSLNNKFLTTSNLKELEYTSIYYQNEDNFSYNFELFDLIKLLSEINKLVISDISNNKLDVIELKLKMFKEKFNEYSKFNQFNEVKLDLDNILFNVRNKILNEKIFEIVRTSKIQESYLLSKELGNFNKLI